MSEQLGEIAYNAYCEARGFKSVRGEPLPHWLQQDDHLKQAWRKAAEAIAAKIHSDTRPG